MNNILNLIFQGILEPIDYLYIQNLLKYSTRKKTKTQFFTTIKKNRMNFSMRFYKKKFHTSLNWWIQHNEYVVCRRMKIFIVITFKGVHIYKTATITRHWKPFIFTSFSIYFYVVFSIFFSVLNGVSPILKMLFYLFYVYIWSFCLFEFRIFIFISLFLLVFERVLWWPFSLFFQLAFFPQ